MRIRSPNLAKLILALYSGFMLLAFFQNCGQVSVEAMPSVAPPEVPVVPTEVDNTTYLKIDNSITDIYRAVFVVDMSESMFAGACPDSIDTWIPDVQPSVNCLAPTGVDPMGNRFEVMLTWIDELQAKVNAGSLTNEQVKILVLPFSNPTEYRFDHWALNYPLNPVIAGALGVTIPEGFTTLAMAKLYLQIIWAVESKIHNLSYNPRIPANVRNAVNAASYLSPNKKGSTGTTVIANALEKMNQKLNVELNYLKTNNLLGKSHFELVFFSDGVPKPHPLHIEAAARYIWERKKSICDGNTIYPVNQNCSNTRNSEYGIMQVNATSCKLRCADYLKTYAETGAVDLPGSEKPVCNAYYSIPYMCHGYTDGSNNQTRWSSQIKCGQCFTLLQQYDWDKTSNEYYYYGRDRFKEKLNQLWGDWTQNRHSNIITKFRTAVNIFKIQHPGAAAWKMSFVRVDSANVLYATQPGEMKKEVNWIVRAQDIFAKKHRFLVLKSPAKPFELFQELKNGQTYKLGMLYVYNRNLRVSNTGAFQADTDGDGIADINETAAARTVARSDGTCLDGLKAMYGQCISLGCNTAIDRDGDGLNQCEEITAGTDDFEADTDEDGILDGSELLYELNPIVDDQTLFTNTDGFSNFDHFVKCFPATVNLNTIPPEKIINITTNLVEYRTESDARGIQVNVPGYRIKVKNLPLISGMTNEIVVVARIDNFSNPMDKRWVFKKYSIVPGQDKFEVLLEDFNNLQMGAP